MKNLLTIVVLFVVVAMFSGSAIAQKRNTDRRVAKFATLQSGVEATVPNKASFQTALENFAKLEDLAKGKFMIMLIQYEDRVEIKNFMFYKPSADRYGPTWAAEPDGSNVQFLPVEKRGEGLMVAQFKIGTTITKPTTTNNVFTIGNRNYVIY